jgi:F0F1-type ATP synthase membrane subunit a
MGVRGRGFIVFLVIVGVLVACALVSFAWFPSMGMGVALPVITVPAEVVAENAFFGLNLTNTIIGTILADIMVILFIAMGWFASKGWRKEVPNKLQALVEVVVEMIYNFLKGVGGTRLRTTPGMWMIAGTIFFFLLAANLLKLFPGVESVGKMHCAYAGTKGYAMIEGWTDTSYRLWVDTPLDSGTSQTAEMEAACNEYFKYHEYDRLEGNVTLDQARADFDAAEVAVSDANIELDNFRATLGETPTAEQQEELLALEEAVALAERNLARANLRATSVESVESLNSQLGALDAQIAALEEAPADDHSEDAAVAEESTVSLADLQAQRDQLIADRNLALTRIQYPGATIALTEAQLNQGVVPFVFHITPFVRGPATDLSLTIMLAVFAVVMVQAYGVYSLGPAYFEKFINITALGNLGKKPLGAIDFVVGLIEIISEIGKIISLAFRLFGNLFAGGVALLAIMFLVSLLLPGIIYGLELVIGVVQALVFSVLFTVFAAQAMESHHGDDHEHAHEH